MENNEDNLNEKLIELGKLYSVLITGKDKLNNIADQESKFNDLKNNSNEEKEKADILNQIEVENNNIDIN
jgi:hypothetical protein